MREAQETTTTTGPGDTVDLKKRANLNGFRQADTAERNLKVVVSHRADWTLFRSLATLAQKAGVAVRELPRLILKELVDNALDVSGACSFGTVDGSVLYVEDQGAGLDGTDEEIAELFSVRRGLVSSKQYRLPTRGALGNGLRVVVGSALASGGRLLVHTLGRSLQLAPREEDGGTDVERIGSWRKRGTRIEVFVGEGLAFDDDDVCSWARRAEVLSRAGGKSYTGKSSPHWYDSDSFFELVRAHPGSIRELVAALDGCSGTKAGAVAEGFGGRACATMDRKECEIVLSRAREVARPVSHQRLGSVGADAFAGRGYVKLDGTFEVLPGRGSISAEVPFVVEVWARRAEEPRAEININRTPITTDVDVRRGGGEHRSSYAIFCGAGLRHRFQVSKGRELDLVINITTPHMPITSDGKAPDLSGVRSVLLEALEKVARKVRGEKTNGAGGKDTLKGLVLDAVDAAIEKTSGGGRLRYALRQLFYVVRDLISVPNLDYGSTFCGIIRDHERDLGAPLPGVYRDPRGVLYHPHLQQTIPVGTLSVERYERPAWTFNKVLYCEKEGFFEVLRSAQWPERHDCALLTSKGQATGAVKDLIDALADSSGDEDLQVFCVHDADAAGTVIYEALQNETKSRPGRKIEIINLGLEAEEAVSMGLDVETTEYGKPPAVGRYVEEPWREWLQGHRVELNSMTSPQFVEWLEQKIERHLGKVVPPVMVLRKECETFARREVEAFHRERILREAGFEEFVARDMESVVRTLDATVTTTLDARVREALHEEPELTWSVPVAEIASGLAEQAVEDASDETLE